MKMRQRYQQFEEIIRQEDPQRKKTGKQLLAIFARKYPDFKISKSTLHRWLKSFDMPRITKEPKGWSKRTNKQIRKQMTNYLSRLGKKDFEKNMLSADFDACLVAIVSVEWADYITENKIPWEQALALKDEAMVKLWEEVDEL
jgi:arginine repressor